MPCYMKRSDRYIAKDVVCNMTNTKENKITEGVIWQQLLLFFFPILFGSFFQQLYNAADAMIVGQFVGKEALSAVGGSTGTITNLLVGFFVSVSSGATVVISQHYGAKRAEMVQSAVHTAMAFGILAGLAIMVVGILAAPAMLRMMNTPADVMDNAVTYIRIFFCGVMGNLLYNIGTGILRAVGDSRRPMYFLIIGCFTNIILDLLFIVVFHWGVAGAAFATILSQALSAVMVLVVLKRTTDMHHLEMRRIRIEKDMFESIIRIGLPAGLSNVMYSVSNIIIQTGVNSLGTDTLAAWTAYSKIDCMFWMMISAFGISLTTFVGQNYGAGKFERVKRSMKVCLGLSAGTTVLVSVLLYHFGGYLLDLFITDPAVKVIGMEVVHYLTPVFITYVTIEIVSGALRGIGDCWVPTILCFVGICVLRIIWLLVVVPRHRDIYMLMFSYPMSWTLTSILSLIYLIFFSRLGIRKRYKK